MSEPLDLLAFGAHPDDVEIVCSGLVAKMAKMGYRVGVCDMTRGEGGSRGTPEQRVAESEKAAKVLGLTVRENLKLPDTHLHADAEGYKAVAAIIRKHRPSVVVAPHWEDVHPDHVATSQLVTHGCYIAHFRKLAADGDELHIPHAIIYYLQRVPVLPTFIVDISEVFDKKIESIACYESVFGPAEVLPATDTSGGPKTINRRLADFSEVNARYWGSRINARYGEAYLYRSFLRIDDPVSFFKQLPTRR